MAPLEFPYLRSCPNIDYVSLVFMVFFFFFSFLLLLFCGCWLCQAISLRISVSSKCLMKVFRQNLFRLTFPTFRCVFAFGFISLIWIWLLLNFSTFFFTLLENLHFSHHFAFKKNFFEIGKN